MTQEATELLRRALTLSEEERAEMASSLIDSLDTIIDTNAEALWQQEIARRIEGLRSGNIKTMSWQDVREKGRAILNGKTGR
jgi:putative addiction module component (TIGR02574 family)